MGQKERPSQKVPVQSRDRVGEHTRTELGRGREDIRRGIQKPRQVLCTEHNFITQIVSQGGGWAAALQTEKWISQREGRERAQFHPQ